MSVQGTTQAPTTTSGGEVSTGSDNQLAEMKAERLASQKFSLDMLREQRASADFDKVFNFISSAIKDGKERGTTAARNMA